MVQQVAPAGWYPSPRPEHAGSVEYWDGQQWTGQVAPQAPIASAPRYKYKTVRTHRDMTRLMRRGWEPVVSSGQQSWFWGSNFRCTMRKPK